MKLQVSMVERGQKSWGIKTDQGQYRAKLNLAGVEQLTGKTIEADTSQSEYNGKVYHWINGFSVLEMTKANNGSSSVDRWYMSFVSNTVAHALQSGRIEQPADISKWAKAAYDTAMALDDPFRDISPE